MKREVKDLKPGDKVDLSKCPYLNREPLAKFELGVVDEIEVETADCIRVDYRNFPSCGYRPTELLEVEP